MRRKLLQLVRGPDAPLVVAALVMIVCGILLRAQRLAFPRVLTWDEHHFVLNAKNYLAHQPDLNDHPPLGKLLIALPIHFLGDHSLAWRLSPFLLGCVNIVLLGLIASWVAQRRTAFWVAAALAAVDGFLIAYSRSALLDGMLVCLCMGAVLLALRARSWSGFALATLLLGSACAIKYSAIVFVPVLLWAALGKRSKIASAATLVLVPAAYTGWFSLGLWMAKRPFDPAAVVAETKRLYLHHASLTHWKHPLLSHWYEWFLPTRPIPMRSDPLSDGRMRVLAAMGNPLVWWLVDAAVLLTIGTLVVSLVLALRRRTVREAILRGLRLEGPIARRSLIVAAWCAPIAPWWLSARDSYLNHYLPAYVFGVVLVAALFDSALRRFRTAAFVALLVVGQVSVYYSPVWGQNPLRREAVEQRALWRRWHVGFSLRSPFDP
ncbi:MAG: phospholipid carrier-dependent glycosyltransferase [Polyangiaceae bacterium]|nr:phospholipid carrier-dependent glycosyltransferase [Polyangiaceae bacterium]